MASAWASYRRRARTCTKRPTWSITKGACRLAPGHKDACKPEGRKRR